MTAQYEYERPRSLSEALALLDRLGEDAHVMAGGTSLMLLMRQDLVRPACVVHLKDIPEMRGLRRTDDGGISMGALTTHAAAERSEVVRSFCGALADAFRSVGTVRIREQGTIGGNLVHADPAQDPPPMLLALDAMARITSSSGERTVPLTEFFRDVFETVLRPGEVLREILVPPLPPGARSSYVKFLPRSRDDYATVSVAAVVSLDPTGGCHDARIALGAAGPTPFRAGAAERSLIGQVLSTAVVERAASLAAEAADPLEDLRGSADYKREMVAVWTRRVLTSLTREDH